MKWSNCARTSMAFLSPRPTESFISSSGTRKRDGQAGGTTAVSPQQDWDATEHVPPIRYGVRRSLGLWAFRPRGRRRGGGPALKAGGAEKGDARLVVAKN